MEVQESKPKQRLFNLIFTEQEMKDFAAIMWKSPLERSSHFFCDLPIEFQSGDHIEGECG